MNDEQSVRRGTQAYQAMQYLAPVLDALIAKAVADLMDAKPCAVLERQIYAKALTEVKKTIEGHIRAGDFAARITA